MHRCPCCEEERESLDCDTWYWGWEMFGNAARYMPHQIPLKICTKCSELMRSVDLAEYQNEQDHMRMGAAHALQILEGLKVARRSELEEAIEAISKYFAEDWAQTYKALYREAREADDKIV